MKKGFLVAIILIAVLTCAFALVACGERTAGVSTTVTYMLNGEVFKTVTVTNAHQSDPGFTPSKSGYTFGGWYTDTALRTPFDFEAYAANNERTDIVVYDKWEVNTYTATFMVGGNIIIEEVRFDADDIYVDEPDVPQRTGYTGEWEDYEIKAENLMINAVYTPITYNITYENTLGAVNTNPATYNIETAITLSDITSLGYTFEGWFVGEEKVESIELGSYGNLTLTAKWADKSTENYVRVNENNELDEDGGYILFGQYPQTIKAANVSIISTTPDTDGYYLGSDGERYAKVVADPNRSGYKFSDNSSVIYGNTYYFKVEPIRWRILSERDGKAFILCDSIIANHYYHHTTSGIMIEEQRVDANNYAYSDIRAWLNDEFYKTAFGDLQQALIQTTEADNSAQSTGYSFNPYACENTFDKVFMLSFSEVSNRDYGFASNQLAYDSAREMITSDYSRATGAYMDTSSSSFGNGWWWLRSSSYTGSALVRYVADDGGVELNFSVSYDNVGVVPALNLMLS